jgi:hypothetical protein
MLDLQYHDIRTAASYYLLEKNGQVDRVVTDPAIQLATHPPQNTRAKLRGTYS